MGHPVLLDSVHVPWLLEVCNLRPSDCDHPDGLCILAPSGLEQVSEC